MHRDIIERHLAHAERHVADAESRIARHRDLVVELERYRQDTTEALTVLAQFQELLELHIHDRDRLRRDFEEWSS